MRINVHLHTILQRQTPEGRVDQLQVEMPEGSTMADLLQHLEISLHPEDLLLVVNGRTAPIDQALQGGDQVNLIPAMSGG
jgi:sulfur carrier protein ThiS